MIYFLTAVALLLVGAVHFERIWAQQPVVDELCVDEETRERLRGLMIEALDSAIQKHTAHMFEVWMKDSRGQPERAAAGMKQGVNAYLHARTSAQKWEPKLC